MSVRWIDQTRTRDTHPDVRGDCTRAAIASLFALPLDTVPDFSADDPVKFYEDVEAFFLSLGYEMVRLDGDVAIDSLHLANGPAARGVPHTIVRRGSKVVHDPHPSRAGLTDIDFIVVPVPLDPSALLPAQVYRDRLQAIMDWVDLAHSASHEFADHGLGLLRGPVFDEARDALDLDAVRALVRPAGEIPDLIDAYRAAVLSADKADRDYYPDQASEDECRRADKAEATTRTALDAAIASHTAAAGTGEEVSAELRALSERATPGPWSLDEMSGFVIGGCEPGQGPDDEVPEDWEPPEDDGDDPYPTAKLSAQLDGRSGEHDVELMVQAVNDLRARISAEDRDRPACGATGQEGERPSAAEGYDYVHRTYGRDFRPGMRVRLENSDRIGTVAPMSPSNGHRVQVTFDGEVHASPCHPNSLTIEQETPHADA